MSEKNGSREPAEPPPVYVSYEQQSVGLWTITRPRSNVVATYQHVHSRYLGVILIVLGVLSVIVGGTDIAIYNYLSAERATWINVNAHGLTAGVLSIIAGGFGIGASKLKTVCQIRAFMVLSITTAVLWLFQVGSGITGAVYVFNVMTPCCYGDCPFFHIPESDYYWSRTSPHWSDLCPSVKTIIGLEIVLVVLALAGGTVAVWASTICCKAACCCGGHNPSNTYGGPEFMVSHQQSRQMVPPACNADLPSSCSQQHLIPPAPSTSYSYDQ